MGLSRGTYQCPIKFVFATATLWSYLEPPPLSSEVYLEIINTDMALRPQEAMTLLPEEAIEIRQEGLGLNLKYQNVRSSKEEKHANIATWLIPTHMLSLRPDTSSFKTKPCLFPVRSSCVRMTVLFSASMVLLLLLSHILFVIICLSPREADLEAEHGSPLNSRDSPHHGWKVQNKDILISQQMNELHSLY